MSQSLMATAVDSKSVQDTESRNTKNNTITLYYGTGNRVAEIISERL